MPLDKTITSHFKGINWKALNTKHKNKYDKAVAEILDSLKGKGVDTDVINIEIDKIYESIRTLDILTRRSGINNKTSLNEHKSNVQCCLQLPLQQT